MSHYTINYINSPAPAFDAVQDIIDYMGAERFQLLTQQLREITNPRLWQVMLSFAGVQGFPVKAWFEHVHGQGSWHESEEQSDEV